MQAGYVSEAFSATVLGGSQRTICHDSDSFLFCASPDKLTIYKPLLNGEPRFGFPPLSTLFNHARENIRRYAQDGYSSNAELFAVSQSTCSKFWIYLKNTMRILTHFLTANGAMERCDRSLWRILFPKRIRFPCMPWENTGNHFSW